MPADTRPAMLDTDIGSDVDDLLALTLLASASEARLIGVTTVYGDTPLRARIARYVCDALGRADVAVAAGRRETQTGRPVWWPGHEGEGIAGLADVRVAETGDGVDVLCQMAREHAGALDLFAIGPLTNVAAALQADERFATNLRYLYVMGGAFWLERAEHNIRCDPEAADIVLRSGIPMTVCGLDVTTQVRLEERDITGIEAGGHRLGALIADQTRRWWAARGRTADHPHDALAVLTAIRPDLFRFERCDVQVALDEPRLGWTMPTGCRDGKVRIAAGVDAERAKAEIVRRLGSGG